MDISDYINIKDITTQIAIVAITSTTAIVGYYWGFKKNPSSNTFMQITPEQYKRNIELERNNAVEEFKKANDDEKAELLGRIRELDRRLENPQKALQEKQEFTTELKADIKHESNEIDTKKLTVAITALKQGDFSKADALFAEIENREKLAVQRAARAAFARGHIAYQEVRWKDAAEHYARAAQLYPRFSTLIAAQKVAREVGNYPSALSLGKKAQKAARDEYTKNSEQYANTLNNLAAVYQDTEQHEKAEPLHEEALLIREKVLGKDHPETASSINNLGIVYQALGEYKKAELFFKRALENSKKTLGEKHLDTAANINNLGAFYEKLNKPEKAEPFLKQSLEIRQGLLKKNHPLLATSLNNLGLFYCKYGKYKKAEPFCKQALEIFEATLGHDHPDTKNSQEIYKRLQKHLP